MKRFYHKVSILATFATQTFCGGSFSLPGASDNLDSHENLRIPALASAGADREVQRGTPTYLNALGSYQPQGHSFNFNWRQIAGEVVQLSNPGAAQPLFVAPLEEQILTFELTILSPETGLSTSDVVQIFVSNTPKRVAPLTAIGPDRYLDFAEPALPPQDDHEWKNVTPQSNNTTLADPNTLSEVSIFCGDRIVNGLRSAPDYLLLFAFDERFRGMAAPVANVQAPSTVEVVKGFELNGEGSSDPNGDSIHYRWRQIEGTPLESTRTPQESGLSFQAPALTQRLRFRLSVSDGLLESAPADIALTVVPLEGSTIPTLPPQPDRQSHSGNVVFLDANPLFKNNDGLSYTWKQTAGPSTTLNIEEQSTGRLTSFITPPKGELGFLVTSLDKNNLPSLPVVARVVVVPDSDNTPPKITLCSNRDSVSPSQVTVTALIEDLEADSIYSILWKSTPSADDLLVEAENLQIDRLCGSIATMPARPSLAVRQALIDLEPSAQRQAGDVIRIDLKACDALGACSGTSLELQIAPEN